MSIASNYRSLAEAICRYEDNLARLSEDIFQQKPAEDSWCMAQVYAHILTANLLTAKAILRSEGKQQDVPSSGLPFRVWLLLFSGRFPKGRKVPKVVEERTPVLRTIAEAREKITELRSDLEKIISNKNLLGSKYRLKHPVLGLLSIPQFIRFMQIHSHHHLRQLERIGKHIGV